MNQPEKEEEAVGQTARAKATMAIDPVCGMLVDPDTAHNKYEHGGKIYYFCSGYCLGMFCSDASRYAHD